MYLPITLPMNLPTGQTFLLKETSEIAPADGNAIEHKIQSNSKRR
jgi:hypothetical protein